MVTSAQPPIQPVQPVENPILNSPYQEPTEHWVYQQNGDPQRMQGRRPASYFYTTERAADVSQPMLTGLAEENREDLELVNTLRKDIRRWRTSGYRGATRFTKELLAYWQREDRPRRLFFCQLEAVETIIYLNELRLAGRNPYFTPAFTEEDAAQLLDLPADHALPPLRRLGVKMATGSGKTVVMAMLIAWAFTNRARVPADERFPQAVLVVCPNLTIKERLQVLRPDHPQNYYDRFDLVPSPLRPLLTQGKVLIENWHRFYPESPNVEAGQSYKVVDKGEESPDAFARRVLGDLYENAPLMVLNDEAHHAWRPARLPEQFLQALDRDEEEAREATIWVQGLDRLNQGAGVRFAVDLSATPFYIQGSGYNQGSPFPWLVSDFGLVDAIEAGIVKIPRLPITDDSGDPIPRYFNLWHEITQELKPAERMPNSNKPKPEVVYRRAQQALTTLAGQWVERFIQIDAASADKDKTPPVLIIVCDNTDIAEYFYRQISGEEEQSFENPETGKVETRTVFTRGDVFAEYFANTPTYRRTVRIDTKLLAEAESREEGQSRQDAAEQLRQIVATVGKLGEPGEQVRCVVSVQMLTEGWDANNVTHILGLRAFTSQLLCEQVVGRGLRRMDYALNPKTGHFDEEYVDIYGVPFSLIPFRGRTTTQSAPEDKPKNLVRALEERAEMEMHFPHVESYAFALQRNFITADIDGIDKLRIDLDDEPVAVFVEPRVGYQQANTPATIVAPGERLVHDRSTYHNSFHQQTIRFEIARRIVARLTETQQVGPQSRHQLFPQVLHIVNAYVDSRVIFGNKHANELGHQKYLSWIVERLTSAIRPDDSQGEPPLLPILNRIKPTGSTAEVYFKTIRRCVPTRKSHINLVAIDSGWEASVTAYLEASSKVQFYARNEQLGLQIPYEWEGVSCRYTPDFLARLMDGTTLLIEVKGEEGEQARTKHTAARRWVSAVNNWGKLGKWAFEVVYNPTHIVSAVARAR